MAGFAEVQRQFVTNGEFTAGLATHYPPGLLVGDDAHLHLAAGYPPGRRFASAEVVRLSESHLDLDWADMHDFLKPRKGRLGLVDYEKVFTPVDDVDKDVFDLRGIDRGAGALVVVRPDQYVSAVLPLDGHDELTEFFGGSCGTTRAEPDCA
jgi:hypothetical protein